MLFQKEEIIFEPAGDDILPRDDPVRIGDDGTLRSLTENLFQADARHNSGADDASQNIARTDTGKLIFVPDHDDPARRPQRAQQAFKEHGIHHAHLVDDHRITAKLVLLVVKKADTVSYTHLDVYKRQAFQSARVIY